MIPEREREALMRLTMCAREDCGMCKYKDTCNFEFQYEIATENMYILADALEVADTPQTDKYKVVCPNCGRSDYIRSFEKDFGIKNSEYRYKCINCNTYIKDTPQTDCLTCRYNSDEWDNPKCDSCSKAHNNYTPQTDCGWK